MDKEKIKNMVKTDYGNIDRDQFLKSTILHGKSTIHRFQKWLNRQNKLLGTNFTVTDFCDEVTSEQISDFISKKERTLRMDAGIAAVKQNAE